MQIANIRQTLEKEQQRLSVELGLFTGLEPNTDRTVSPFNKKMEAASQITEYEHRLVTLEG